MILSGKDLIDRVYKDNILPKSSWEYFNGWQFDLTLGKQAFITGRNEPVVLEKNNYLTIQPGEFALLLTGETVKMPPDLMAFIAVRFSYKKKGLLNISGFHVDPGFEGKLIFSVYNAGPSDILMQSGNPVFMIFFSKLSQNVFDGAEKLKSGEYELPEELDEHKEKIEKELGKKRKLYEDGIPLDMMTSIQGTSVSLSQNNNRIERLENMIKIYGSIAVAIIISLIGIALR